MDRVSLKNSSFEGEWVGPPLRGLDNTLGVAIAALEVLENVVGEEIPTKGFVNEGVWDTPKGIFKVKECHVARQLPVFSIHDDFLQGSIVLDTPINSWEECLLHGGVSSNRQNPPIQQNCYS